MKYGFSLAVIATAITLAACAQSSTSEAIPVPNPDLAGSAVWTANILPVHQDRFYAPDSTKDRSYGSALWKRGATPSVSNIDLAFTYAGTEKALTWGIFFGRCGVASLPVVPLSSFPELENTAGVRSQTTTTLSLDLPTNGAYHVAVFRERRGGVDSLVGCGNLRLSGG